MRPGALRAALLLLALPALLLGLGLGVQLRKEPAPAWPAFSWAGGRPPSELVGAAVSAGVSSSALAARGPAFQVTVLARFPDGQRAAAGAAALRELLAVSAEHYGQHLSLQSLLFDPEVRPPLTPPEAIRLAKYGVTGLEGGVGWPGEALDAPEAVVQMGRLLVVGGLKGDPAGSQPNPLGRYLKQLGGEAWLENDPADPTRLVFDVSCALPDARAASELARELRGYLDSPLELAPPWRVRSFDPAEAEAEDGGAPLGITRVGSARSIGSGLSISGLEFRRLAPGLNALLVYLTQAGADEVRLAVTRHDD